MQLAEAQASLGVMYYQGKGVPRDYAEVVKWYRLAAEQGRHEYAFSDMKSCYRFGRHLRGDKLLVRSKDNTSSRT